VAIGLFLVAFIIILMQNLTIGKPIMMA